MNPRAERFTLVLLCAVAASPALRAEDPFSLFREEARVTTASRREQPMNESPVAIDVITADDIAASKAINLWDLLRYRSGVNVMETRTLNDNRAIVSVRGFGEEFNNNLQVLVDGRSVYQGAFGGVLWEQIPVQIQDIERIEIVRGPNTALYGSNAGLGVISILTKEAAGTGASVNLLRGNLDLNGVQSSAEAAGDHFGVRVSQSYIDDNRLIVSDGSSNDDDLHSNKLNFRGFWKPTAKSKLELLSGISWDTMANAGSNGAFLFGSAPSLDFRDHFQQLRYSLSTGERSSLELMGARRDTSVERASREYQYDGEAVERMQSSNGRAHTTIGGSYRSYNAYFPFMFTAATPHQRDELVRGFLQQSWQPMEWLILNGAASEERTTMFGSDPAFQAAIVSPISPRHTLRASYSVSSTLPSMVEKKLNVVIPYAGVGDVMVAGDENITPSRVRSYELSHLGTFANRRLETELTGFYMTLRNIPTLISVDPLLSVYRNANEATARGVEAKATYRFRKRRLIYANYGYETITDDQDVYGPAAPGHTFNVGALMPLGHGFSTSFDAGYTDHYTAISSLGRTGIPAFIRLDARLVYSRDNWEVYAAGSNLTRPFKQEYAGTTLATPRLVYFGLSVRLGDQTPASNAGR